MKLKGLGRKSTEMLWKKFKEQLSSIEIGGRNLIQGSKCFSSGVFYTEGCCDISEKVGSFTVLKAKRPTNMKYYNPIQQNVPYESNTTYTLSFYAKADTEYTIHSYFYNIGTDDQYENGDTSITLTTSWKRYTISWTTKDSTRKTAYVIPMRLMGDCDTWCYIYGVKMEKGTIPTDWTPALEDPADNLNAYTTQLSNKANLTPGAEAIAASPYSGDLWHDHFAFLNDHALEDSQISMDGVNWSDEDKAITANLKRLFSQRDAATIELLNTAQRARRFTIHSTNIAWSFIEWYELAVGYANPASNFEILIEASRDKNTWVLIHDSVIISASTPFYLYGAALDNNIYIRFTFSKTTNLTTGAVNVSSLKALTKRKGNSGRGGEFEYPYDWNYMRDMYPHDDAQRSLGLSGRRWKNVYSETFHGALNGSASEVNDHTVDADVPSDAKFTDTTYTEFQGTEGTSDGAPGLVPAPKASEFGNSYGLGSDGRWRDFGQTFVSQSFAEEAYVTNEALKNAIEELKKYVDKQSPGGVTLDSVYPIGSVYISANGANPNAIIGGTWEEFATGRTLIGYDPADDDLTETGMTGGEKTHVLTADELPEHNHDVTVENKELTGSVWNFVGQNANFGPGNSTSGVFSKGGDGTCFYPSSTGKAVGVNDGFTLDATHGHTATSGNTGSGTAHNNMMPYITVRMWKRTA